MNKEEKEFFYSIGRGSLNLNGKFYYGLDYSITDFINSLEEENKKYKEAIDKAIEYITSYESISTIQGLTYIEANKQFDEKTMTEMINRYLLVHDKLLEILEDKEVSE